MSGIATNHSKEWILGNNQLPISNHRAETEHAILNNPVTLLVGPTGSGKTTQEPQFAYETGYFDEIIVTQPRIVAARTVSERISSEIDSKNYGSPVNVGYYTSKEGSESPQRKQDIVLMTDGKAAMQLLYGMEDDAVSDRKRLLTIDEVHERNQNIDLLLAIAKEKTDPNSKFYDPNFRVVIMSATVDTKRLQQYFSNVNPPIIDVEVPTYPVKRLTTNRSVASVALKSAIDTNKTALVFLPGKREIERTKDAIERKQLDSTISRPVIPLHGQQKSSDQKAAFKSYRYGAMVLATNAAQTSITIPSVKTVIDSGKVRNSRVRYDLVSAGSEGLYLEDAAQADLLQRLGRTGRTEPGRYVLASVDGHIPPTPFEDRSKYPVPAIKSDRLDDLLLTIKATGHNLEDFRFLDKPPQEAINAARTRLYNIGAIDKQGRITVRGREMNRLPLDIEYSAMIVFAKEKGYNSEVLANLVDIASIMQVGGLFKKSPRKQEWRELLESTPQGETKEGDSDFLAQLEAYVRLRKMGSISNLDGFDINGYAYSLVEKTRKSLAAKLGINLCEPEVVDPSNRQTVLTCINAGQINQVWCRSGEKWRALLEESSSFKLSPSSVVRDLGGLVTGKLFTLGIENDDEKNIIEDVNKVANMESLELAAGHLISENILKDTAQYDAESGQFTAEVEKRLGNIVLRSVKTVVSSDAVPIKVKEIQASHQANEFDKFINMQDFESPYSIEEIGDKIKNPEFRQYGVDIVTGEPLLAWKGGKGRWHISKEVAVKSLEAREMYYRNSPAKQETKQLKARAKILFPQINRIKKGSTALSMEAEELMKVKKRTPVDRWIEDAQNLIERFNSSEHGGTIY